MTNYVLIPKDLLERVLSTQQDVHAARACVTSASPGLELLCATTVLNAHIDTLNELTTQLIKAYDNAHSGMIDGARVFMLADCDECSE